MFETAKKLLSPEWICDSNIVLFEDDDVATDLFPLTVLRPAWAIRAGLGSLWTWVNAYRNHGNAVVHRSRASMSAMGAMLAGYWDDRLDLERPTVFLNGRVMVLKGSPPASGFVTDSTGRVLWAKLSGQRVYDLLGKSGTEIAHDLVKQVGGVSTPSEDVRSAAWVWDYMAANEELLALGFADVGESLLDSARVAPLGGVHLVGENPVFAGEDLRVLPTVVLDTTLGPIWMGSDVQVQPHCYLQGPLAIGDHGRIKAGTKLYPGSSFGSHCRIAGEISHSILQGYVNKQHDGFLGNSHLGQWVNLGADTTVSNLRNDYGSVKVKVAQKLVDSGQRFVGLICGDHTKTGINTMFNTGTVVGVAANVYGGGYPPRFIRSFSWGGKDGFHTEPLDRTLESARIVMSRRDRALTEEERTLLEQHYLETVKQETQG